MALGMPRGSLSFPGPGFFPLLVGGFLVLAAGGRLVQACTSGARPPGTDAPPRAPGTRRAAVLTVLLVAYGLALKPLGFPLAIALFVLAAIRVFGYRRWAAAVAVAVGLTAASYVAFVAWLKVPLPMGVVAGLLD
jgi:hypothetical protein